MYSLLEVDKSSTHGNDSWNEYSTMEYSMTNDGLVVEQYETTSSISFLSSHELPNSESSLEPGLLVDDDDERLLKHKSTCLERSTSLINTKVPLFR